MATALVILKTAGIVLGANYGAHVVAGSLYGKFCIPENVCGIARSIVATASPVCSTLLNVMTITQNNYAVVLTTTIAGVVATVLKLKD